MTHRYQPVPLDPKARAFLDSISDAPRTVETYESALKAFSAFRLRGQRDASTNRPTPLSLQRLDVNILAAFYKWMEKRGFARRTRNTYLAGAYAFLEYALDQDWLPAGFDLARAHYRQKKAAPKRISYPIPKIEPQLPQVVTYFDALPLPPPGPDTRLERLRILRGRALLYALYSTAGRIGELASLSRKDVQDGRLEQVLVVGKGDKERFLTFVPEARAALAAYLAERGDACEPLFIRHHKGYGERLSRSMLWKIVVRAGAECGIKIHPHEFRHFRARQMLAQGAPLEAIQEILGHSDIGTTRKVYAHYDKKTVHNIFANTYVAPAQAASPG